MASPVVIAELGTRAHMGTKITAYDPSQHTLLTSQPTSSHPFEKRAGKPLHTRSMFSRAVPGGVLKSTQGSYPNIANINKRNMSAYHVVRLKEKAAKPVIKDVDLSGKHTLLATTTCVEPHCKTANCADPKSANTCPGRTAEQNKTSIPPSGGKHTTKLSGNFTSKIPKGKKGVCINPDKNLKNEPKAQYLVQPPKEEPIDSNDLKVDKKKTNAIQEQHENINDIIAKSHEKT